MIDATHCSTPARRLRRGLPALAAPLLAGILFLAPARPVGAQAQVNDVAPDFTFTNLLPGPTTVTLSDYRGSVVVLTTFAYW